MTNKFIVLLLVWCGCIQISTAQTASLTTYLDENNIATEQAYGLSYQINKAGQGTKPRKGDYVVVHFKASLLDGTVFEASEPNEPFVFQVGYNQVIRGWDLGATLLSVGSQGTFFIPSNLGYGKRGAGKMVPPNADLILELELLKILSPKEYDAYMLELEKKEKAAFDAKIKEQFKIDKKIIQDYALTNKLRTKRTDSGLSYAIIKKGKGPIAQEGDELEVQYEGFLADGSPFDKTKKEDSYTFTLGKGKVIEGWDEGLQYFNQGCEGWLLIPSQLAYGPRPIYEKNISIPGNSVLIFKIKVLRVKKERN